MVTLEDRSARLDRADFPVDAGLVLAAAAMAEDEGGRWADGDREHGVGGSVTDCPCGRRHAVIASGVGRGATAREEMVALGRKFGFSEDEARRSVTRGILLGLNPPGGIPTIRTVPTRTPTAPRAA